MIGSLLIANRGEIARRVIRTARRLGVHTVAVHSDVDAGLPFVVEADEAVPIGAPQAYRNVEAILAAAKSTGKLDITPQDSQAAVRHSGVRRSRRAVAGAADRCRAACHGRRENDRTVVHFP